MLVMILSHLSVYLFSHGLATPTLSSPLLVQRMANSSNSSDP